jgi:hypothetical protein
MGATLAAVGAGKPNGHVNVAPKLANDKRISQGGKPEDADLKPVEPVPSNVMPAWTVAHNGYPFIDFGGRAELTMSSFSPSLLKGLSRVQIASDLAHAGRPVAQAIDGTANQLTAAVCLATSDKPTKVCGSKTISTLQRSLRR